MDLIKTRSRSLSNPRTKNVIRAILVISFLGITLWIFTPIRFVYQSQIDTSDCDFPAIFNFGESNSDTGGKSAAFHRISYPNGESFFHKASGRYCDGKVILDFFADKLGLPYASAYLNSMGTNFRHGANFATGGSTIQPLDSKIFQSGFSPISLDIQLSQFTQFKSRTEELFKEDKDTASSAYVKTGLPRPEDFSKALYTLDIGQNDLHFGLMSMTEDELKAMLPKIVGILAQTIKELYQLGGRTFWIHNTGPIGCLPYSLIHFPPMPENVDQIGCIKSQNDVANEFNILLKQKVSELRVNLADAVLIYVDVNAAKYSLISEAKKHGFNNPLEYCCGHYGDYNVQCGKKAVVNGTEIDGSACEDPSKYINWDGVHYSHSANEFVAQLILDGSLSDPPIPITKACNRTSISR